VILNSAAVSFTSAATPADNPRASIGLVTKTGDGTSVSVEVGIPVTQAATGFGGASGIVDLGGVVAKAESLGNADVGQVFFVRACLNRGAAPLGTTANVMLNVTLPPS